MDATELATELHAIVAWIEDKVAVLRSLADGKLSAKARSQLLAEAIQWEARAERLRRTLERNGQTESAERLCDDCGTVIPEERLELLPDTMVCVRCAGGTRSDRGRKPGGPHR